MANYTIGDMIYETRIARGYSQEELSFGICSTSSLSRIENNQQVPGKRLFDALMQRLGVSESIFSSFISREDMELYRLTQQLEWSVERSDNQKISEIIVELESKIRDKHMFEQQYVLYAKAHILSMQGGRRKEVIELLMDAIHITMPDFVPENGTKRRLLTFLEITILSFLATELYDDEEQIISLKLMLELKEYMEKHIIDEEEKAKKYPMIIYNITKQIGNQGMHEEVYRLCDSAIDFCVEHNKLIALPYLLTNMACAAAEIHKLEEAKDLFLQAITLYTICKKESYAKHLRKNVPVDYGIELD